jgi:hypothetical protein
MPYLLDFMPFSEEPGEVSIRGERVRIRANQIILWVTLSLQRVKAANLLATPFPAILDTGHNHTFSIHERHLTEWAGLRPDLLIALGTSRDRGQRILLRAANIWIHPNERGSRERLAERSPHLIEAKKGIAVYPGDDFPRLPIMGLRAIAENNLILKVDGARRRATLRTPIRWWPFA